jgi:hypothetical protein
MPAAWGWQTWRASESTGDCGSRGVGIEGGRARPESLWGGMAAAERRQQTQDSRGGGSDGKTCSLPNGLRTGPVTSDVVANSRDQPHKRARGTKAGTVTTPHSLHRENSQKRVGCPCSCHMCGGIAAEAPNKGMEPTASSVRCAPASGSGSYLALDLSSPWGAGRDSENAILSTRNATSASWRGILL